MLDFSCIKLLQIVRDALWQGPVLWLIIGAGLYLTITLRGLQFRYLGYALKLVLDPFKGEHKKTAEELELEKNSGDISSFQSLMTALAGAIGTGNITGIATAVLYGGVGALFWMWAIAFIGMATAYSETVLGLKYRHKNANGEMSGGPMYTLLYGVKSPVLAALFAVFAAVAAIGLGALVQSHSVGDAFFKIFAIDHKLIGIALAVVTGVVVIGGVKSIGNVAGVLVPFMALAYLASGLVVLVVNYANILPALKNIVTSALSLKAVAGGAGGMTIAMMLALQNGAQYGVFANEAGLGSLSIAGASAQTRHPSKQGMLAISGVFISTMVVCTITGLVLAVTNSTDPMQAFSSIHPHLKYVVLIGLILFAFTTILAWAYYGEKCTEYMLGPKSILPYRGIFVIAVFTGCLLKLEVVWDISHILNALMCFPNIISLIWLSKEVKVLTKEYIAVLAEKKG